MARVIRLFENPKERSGAHRTSVECGWTAVQTGGDPLLQLETYGSADRRIPGKVSQSIQLDRNQALELVAIIRNVFPGIG